MLNFEDALTLRSNKYGQMEFVYDGAEGIAFWLLFEDQKGEPWYRFTFDEAEEIRDFLNYWFPKEDEA